MSMIRLILSLWYCYLLPKGLASSATQVEAGVEKSRKLLRTQNGAASVGREVSSLQFPIHSWETFPVSFHSCRQDTYGPTGLEWLPEDLQSLQRYPLVTIEKWHGAMAYSTEVCEGGEEGEDANNCLGDQTRQTNKFVWEDEAWVFAAKQIKELNPNISVAVWMDTMLIYTGWTWPPPPKSTKDNLNRTFNKDILGPCGTGHFRPTEFLESAAGHDYLLKNTSELPALQPWSNCHIYDYSKKFVQDYWKDLCLNMTKTGVIDGCGADFSALGENEWSVHTTETIAEHYGLDMETAELWNRGHRQMMIDTTNSLESQGGFLIGKDHFELGDHVNGVLQEGCPPRNSTIGLLQNLTATAKRLGRRLLYQCHATDPTVESMAAFLCGAGPDHYFTTGGWVNEEAGFPSHWKPEFERPLGEPLSECIYDDDTQVWGRSFASGTTVWFNANSNTGGINWKDGGNDLKEEEEQRGSLKID